MLRPDIIRFWFVLVAGLSLASCGYQLAGTTELPDDLSSIVLQTSDLSQRQQEALQLQLIRAGARLVSHEDSKAVLLMVSLKVLDDRRLVSSASNGKTVERLSRSLTFNLKSADGGLLAPTKTLLLQEDIVLDDDNLLSSSRQKARMLENLEQGLFEKLIRQLKRI